VSVQLVLPWWAAPEPRVQPEQQHRVHVDDPPQITIPDWLWAFGYTDAAETYCEIPQNIQWAKAHWGFTQTESRVLDALLFKQYQWHKDMGPKAMGYKDFTFITRLDRRTVRNGLGALEELRVISVTRRGRGRRSLYAVNPAEAWCPKSSSTRRAAAPSLSALAFVVPVRVN
jgi:hypothetical protein